MYKVNIDISSHLIYIQKLTSFGCNQVIKCFQTVRCFLSADQNQLDRTATTEYEISAKLR